jgi:Holliday junction resolvase
MVGSLGSDAERELSNTLEDEYRWAAMPAGGSGSGTKRARPDVLATRRASAGVPGTAGPHGLAIELKKRTQDWPCSVYLDADEVRALQSFASRGGLRAFVVVRPHRSRSAQDWHCFTAGDLRRTDSGRSIHKRDLPGMTLEQVASDD